MNHRAMLHQIREASDRLRSWLKSLRGNKNLLIIIAGVSIAGAYFFFGGLLPDYYITNHYTEGHKIVGLYSHLYRYCEFFGWLAILLLIPPVIFLASQKIDVRKNKLFIFIALLLLSLFPVAAMLIDQRSLNAAPHEVRPDIVKNNPALKDHFIKGPPTPEQKQAYQSMMNSLLKDKANRSVAWFLHYLTIYLLTLQLVALGVIVVALLRFGPARPPGQSSGYTTALVSCSLAIFVSYLWVLMRVAFVAQKPTYFPAVSLPVTEGVLLGFSLLTTLVIALRLLNLYERQQALSLLITLAMAVFGLLLSGFNWAKFQQMLVIAFGRDAEVTQYWLILGATIFLLLFIALLGHPPKESGEGQEN